ncbi:MAG TPA: YHS domain-containing protein, partial [Elusimicrobiales bacterium]|nr:YHS domain-containing protein [Elusimicrobiales bacterium]
MKKTLLTILITASIGFNFNIDAQNTETNQEKNTVLNHENIANLFICPVSLEKRQITKDTPKLNYKDKTYYFCCLNCLEKFKKEPDKYIKETKENAIIGNKLLCPVMKTEFNPTSDSPKTEYKGKTYYFCCPDCVEKFNKNPNNYPIKQTKSKNTCKHCGKEEHKSKRCGNCPSHKG